MAEETRPTTHTNNGDQQQPVDVETQQFTTMDGGESDKPKRSSFSTLEEFMRAKANYLKKKADEGKTSDDAWRESYKKAYTEAIKQLKEYGYISDDFLAEAEKVFANAPEPFQKVFEVANGKVPLKFKYEASDTSCWSPYSDSLFMDEKSCKNKIDFLYTLFHEIGHYIDDISQREEKHKMMHMGRQEFFSVKSHLCDKIKKSLKNDVVLNVVKTIQSNPETGETWTDKEFIDFSSGDKYQEYLGRWGGLFDIAGASKSKPGKYILKFTTREGAITYEYTIKSGHRASYYKMDLNRIHSESFANLNSAYVMSVFEPHTWETYISACGMLAKDFEEMYKKMAESANNSKGEKQE